MSKISTYSLADTPLQLSDRLIGTEAPRPQPTATPLATKNFSLGELLQLFSANFPAATLQAVLNAGNIATQNITLTGTITSTLIKPTNIEDTSGSQGTTFQFLSKGTSSISWANIPVDNLQAVLNAGNTATQNINLTGNITSTKIIPGNIQDDTAGIGTTGQFLSKTTSGIRWINAPTASTPSLGDVVSVGNVTFQDIYANLFYTNTGYGLLDDGTLIGQSFQFPINNSYLTYLGSTFNTWQLPNASGTIALTSDIPGAITLTTTGTSGPATLIGSVLNIPNYATSGAQNLNDVLTVGNTSIIDANIGTLGIWDVVEGAYAKISSTDNLFAIKDPLTNTLLSIEQGSLYLNKTNSINAKVSVGNLTSNRTYYLPDSTGTIALTSDIPGAAYTKYIGNITQIGTGNPSVLVLENTIGNIVWTRTGVGAYEGNLLGAFPVNSKVWFAKPNVEGSGLRYNLTFFGSNPGVVYLYQYANDNTTPIDGIDLASIEIRVYP